MQIAWLASAFADLHRVRDYIRQYNPIAAQKTVAAIEASAKNLARFPEMGPPGEVPGTRELVIPGLPYFVVYRLKGDQVQILRVLHDKQKWPTSS
jgi:addiction module RelE/StbE family toxin